jgi:iron complex transport system ATP-binding protein
MNMEPAQKTIDLQQLSIGYMTRNSRKSVAANITAGIYNGELTCLLGANGAGKSTLLRTLAGFQPKLAGRIFICGREIEAYSEKQLSRLAGVVLTEKCEVKNMTVRELVGLGRSPYTGFWGTLKKRDGEVVQHAMELVHAEALAGRMIHALSDGERQKVMIAKALAQETPVIFLDEPTAYLDFPSKVEIMQLLHQLSRTIRKTIFLSTHDLELALQLADKIWLMNLAGSIRTGTPEDLALNGSLGAFFARDGITFDTASGLFRIDHRYHRRIRLTGQGQKFAMVRKALQRNGILAGNEVESDIHIATGDPSSPAFHLHTVQQGKSFTVHSVEELLYRLSIIFNDEL